MISGMGIHLLAHVLTIIRLSESVARSGNQWDTLAIPTMRTPEDVSWDKEFVYNTMRAFLVELERWNAVHRDDPANIIHTIVMTGLGTDQGGMSRKRSVQQMVLAVKHFQEGIPPPHPAHHYGPHVRWDDVRVRSEKVRVTGDY
ncbi:hypothetical protein BD779DRAFT_1694765 [Infundibulicybe gibba]|nr:hypothetical protein BD779DRAFT_1694765 [Infundibulicybe gibba]